MLLECWECDGKVASTASACPHCGNPVPSDAENNWFEWQDDEDEDDEDEDDEDDEDEDDEDDEAVEVDGEALLIDQGLFACSVDMVFPKSARDLASGARMRTEVQVHKWTGSPGFWSCKRCATKVQPTDELMFCPRRGGGKLHVWASHSSRFDPALLFKCKRCDVEHRTTFQFGVR
jgi:hypothetical protein